MRVSRVRWFVPLCALLLAIASDVWSQEMVERMSGVGLIDFRDKPRFKVGDWVKYKFKSHTPDGRTRDDYEMTMIISGEEKFWGDDCFWVETWVKGKATPFKATAVCISYSVFGDTSWLQRLQVYHRKQADVDPDGGIYQELVRRSMKYRATPGNHPSFTILTDTLGMDTATVAKGFYRVQKVERRQGIGKTEERADSTQRIENWDRWTLSLSRQVPITSLVREQHEKWTTRKAWKAGDSEHATTDDVFRATGMLELVDFGSGNMIPRLTPEYARGPLKGKKDTSRPARPRRG